MTVTLELYGQLNVGGTDDVWCYVWVVGFGWVWVGTVNMPLNVPTWVGVDVSTNLTTSTAINNTRLRLGFTTTTGSITIYMARLNVNGIYKYIDDWILDTVGAGVSLVGTPPYLVMPTTINLDWDAVSGQSVVHVHDYGILQVGDIVSISDSVNTETNTIFSFTVEGDGYYIHFNNPIANNYLMSQGALVLYATSYVLGTGTIDLASYWIFDNTFIGGPFVDIGILDKYEGTPSQIFLEIVGGCPDVNPAHVECYLWINSVWVDVGEILITTDSSIFHQLDVSSRFNSYTEINDTRLKLILNTDSATHFTVLYKARLVVDGIVLWCNSFTNDVVDAGITLFNNWPYLQNTYLDAVIGQTFQSITCSYFEFEYISPTGTTIGPLNLPYARLSENIQTVIEKTYTTNFIPWEWWIDYTGAFKMAEFRGSTKAINLRAANEIGGSILESSCKQSSQRVKVVGGGEAAAQDINTSDWQEDTTKMSIIHSFYENVVGDKTVSQKFIADEWAKVILAQSSSLIQEVTVRLLDDPYTTNDFDVGDTITITDPDTGISGQYRIKTIDKTVNDVSGETTVLTCSQNKTDITDRLADIYKTVQRIMNSSTFLDTFMGQGGAQTKVAASTLEDVWSATSSNKWITELPEADETDKFDECFVAGRQNISWDCTTDEFYVTGAANDAMGAVWINDPLIQFSRNPRFQCEFLIDTLNGGDPWQTYDQIFIRVHGIDTCAPPWNTWGFGFTIQKTASNYELNAWVGDSVTATALTIKHLTINEKYLVEARLEWEERVVKFYFGKSGVDVTDPEWGFRLRAILPLHLETIDCYDLAPFHCLLSADSTVTKPKIYIYRWKTQCNSSVITP